MPDLSWSDWATIALAIMGMFYLTMKAGEFFIGLLYDFGWCKVRYTWLKNRKDLAINNLARAFNLSKATVGEKHVLRLTKGYSLIIISDEEAKRIWAEADAKQEETPCGTSSTTAP